MCSLLGFFVCKLQKIENGEKTTSGNSTHEEEQSAYVSAKAKGLVISKEERAEMQKASVVAAPLSKKVEIEGRRGKQEAAATAGTEGKKDAATKSRENLSVNGRRKRKKKMAGVYRDALKVILSRNCKNFTCSITKGSEPTVEQ